MIVAHLSTTLDDSKLDADLQAEGQGMTTILNPTTLRTK